MEPRNEGPKMGVAKTSQTNTARSLAVTQVHHGNPRGLVSQTYRMSSLLVCPIARLFGVFSELLTTDSMKSAYCARAGGVLTLRNGCISNATFQWSPVHVFLERYHHT